VSAFTSEIGTSRHFTALQNLVATGGIAEIEQVVPIKLARVYGVTPVFLF